MITKLPVKKGEYALPADVGRMLSIDGSNVRRKLSALKEKRPDFVERHCLVVGSGKNCRTLLDRVATATLVCRGTSQDFWLVMEMLDYLDSSGQEEQLCSFISGYYRKFPGVRPDAL